MPIITDPPVSISGSPPDTWPGVTSGSSTTWRTVGPYQVGTSLYIVLEGTPSSNTPPQMWKSVDGGLTWLRKNSAGEPAEAAGYHWPFVDGTNIQVCGTYSNTVPAVSTIVGVVIFDTTTDTWGTPIKSDINIAIPAALLVAKNPTSGDLLVITVVGVDLSWIRFSGGGWGTLFGAVIASTIFTDRGGLVIDTSGVAHLTYITDTNISGSSQIRYRTISVANNVSTASGVGAAGNSANFRHRNSIIWNDRILIPTRGGGFWVGTPVAAPIWSFVTVTGANNRGLLVPIDGSSIYFFYLKTDSATFIDLRRTTWNGTSFSGDVVYYDALGNPPPTGGAAVLANAQTLSQWTGTLYTNGEVGIALEMVYDEPDNNTSMYYFGVPFPLTEPLELDIVLPCGEYGQSYTGTLLATGGVEPYFFEVISGTLPTGLTLDEDTGIISGTAPSVATLPVDLIFQVTDADDETATVEATIKFISVILTTTLEFQVGVYIDITLDFIANPGFVIEIVSGTLPIGLTLDGTTGRIYGYLDPANYPDDDSVITEITLSISDNDCDVFEIEITVTEVVCPVLTDLIVYTRRYLNDVS